MAHDKPRSRGVSPDDPLAAGTHDTNAAGKISHCGACIEECSYYCCDFDADANSGNFLALYPGEWEAAEAAGWDLSNLEVVAEDADGGLRCTTKHRRCCQIPMSEEEPARGKGFYKSFECQVYPLWPRFHNDDVRLRVSERCPIDRRGLDLSAQAARVSGLMQEVATEPRVKRWFQYQHCAGTYLDYPVAWQRPAVTHISHWESGSDVLVVSVDSSVIRMGFSGGGPAPALIRELLAITAATCGPDAERIRYSIPVPEAAQAVITTLVSEARQRRAGNIPSQNSRIRFPSAPDQPTQTAVRHDSGPGQVLLDVRPGPEAGALGSATGLEETLAWLGSALKALTTGKELPPPGQQEGYAVLLWQYARSRTN